MQCKHTKEYTSCCKLKCYTCYFKINPYQEMLNQLADFQSKLINYFLWEHFIGWYGLRKFWAFQKHLPGETVGVFVGKVVPTWSIICTGQIVTFISTPSQYTIMYWVNQFRVKLSIRANQEHVGDTEPYNFIRLIPEAWK